MDKLAYQDGIRAAWLDAVKTADGDTRRRVGGAALGAAGGFGAGLLPLMAHVPMGPEISMLGGVGGGGALGAISPQAGGTLAGAAGGGILGSSLGGLLTSAILRRANPRALAQNFKNSLLAARIGAGAGAGLGGLGGYALSGEGEEEGIADEDNVEPSTAARVAGGLGGAAGGGSLGFLLSHLGGSGKHRLLGTILGALGGGALGTASPEAGAAVGGGGVGLLGGGYGGAKLLSPATVHGLIAGSGTGAALGALGAHKAMRAFLHHPHRTE